jgi:preprotein translocase subunit SecF
MEFFKIKRDIPFMRHALIFNVISALTFVAAVFFLVTKHLNFSVEFTGGTVMELRYPHAADQEKVRTTLRGLGYEAPEVASFGTAQDIMLRLPPVKNASGAAASTRLSLPSARPKAARRNRSTCSRRASKSRAPAARTRPAPKSSRCSASTSSARRSATNWPTNGLNALLMVVIGVVVYLAVRFEWKFAVAAILANLHDVVIILGFFAFFQWEFSLTVLAAILAVLGYSVNESVVIFDRIRETFRKQRKMSVTRGHRPRDHQHHFAHDHHPRLYPDDGAVDAVLRRPVAAPLRGRADHRHLLRYLFVGVRGRGAGHVVRREARRPDQAGQGKGRDGRRRRVIVVGHACMRPAKKNAAPAKARAAFFISLGSILPRI